jgi:hypothetical protein
MEEIEVIWAGKKNASQMRTVADDGARHGSLVFGAEVAVVKRRLPLAS